MQPSIFRKYDIRGIVGKDLLCADVALFGRALARYFVQSNPGLTTVALGMDGRVHSAEIKEQLVAALLAHGLNVQFIGVCPTPVVYFALHTTAVQAGIMITASHNEKEYNGFKICLGKDMVWDKEIGFIRDLYEQEKKNPSELTHKKPGIVTEVSLVNNYLDYLEEQFAHLKNSVQKLVFDCGNGAAGAVVPELVRRMEWRSVRIINGEVDGNFPNCAPDPTAKKNKDNLAAALADSLFDCGIAFDGDADRMVPMTAQGKSLTGDIVLALFAESIAQKNLDNGMQQDIASSVVFDSKCSLVLHEMLQKWGIKYAMAATGIAVVKQAMRQAGAQLAGELSCHFIFADRYFGYDDGIYAALRLIEILETAGKNLDQLIERFPKMFTTGEVRIACVEDRKQEIVDAVHKAFKEQYKLDKSLCDIQTLDGVRIGMPFGWGIVRASNTQPVISFSCESSTPEGFEKIKYEFSRALASSYEKNILHKEFEIESLVAQ